MAAEKIGRKAYCIEYEASFVDVAIRRWQAYTKKDVILDGDGRTFEEIAAERLASVNRISGPPFLQDCTRNESEASNTEDWVAVRDDTNATFDVGSAK
jgi:hypothetical protein